MSPVLYVLLGVVIGGLVSAVVIFTPLVREALSPKTTPNHARLIARPGATLDLVSDDGVVQAKVILSNITHIYDVGTDALFVDYYRYMERNRINGRDADQG